MNPAATRRPWTCLAVLVILAGCGGSGDPRLEEEIAGLRRNNAALAETVMDARAGTLIRPGNVVVGIHEKAVASMFESILPFTRTIAGGVTGSVELRVEHVSVRFDGGLGTVRVEGRAWLSRWPNVAAEVSFSGGFTEAKLLPSRRLLLARIGLDTLEARPLPGGLMAKLLRRDLLRTLNAFGRQEVASLLPPLNVPVKLDQSLRVPNIEDDPLHVRGGALQLSVTVTHLWANDERLWVELEPKVGEWQRNPQAPDGAAP